jgi:hypothetical protein
MSEGIRGPVRTLQVPDTFPVRPGFAPLNDSDVRLLFRVVAAATE